METVADRKSIFTEYDDNMIIKERILNRKLWKVVALHPHFQSKGFSEKQLRDRRRTLEKAGKILKYERGTKTTATGKLKKYERMGSTTNAHISFTAHDEKELLHQYSIHGNKWTYISQNCMKLSKYTPAFLRSRYSNLKKKEAVQESITYRKIWSDIETTTLMEQISKFGTSAGEIINWTLVAGHPVLCGRSIPQMKSKWARIVFNNKNESAVTTKPPHLICQIRNPKKSAERSTPSSQSTKRAQEAAVRSRGIETSSNPLTGNDINKGVKRMTLKISFNTSLGKKELYREFEFEKRSNEDQVLANALLGRLWKVQGTKAFI